GGVAVDVAAVEEHDRALGEGGGRRADEPLEVGEAGLVRQRGLVRRDEHDPVLAERAEDLVHRQQRAERVAVGVLVRDQEEALCTPQLGDHLRARGGLAALADGHLVLPPSSSSGRLSSSSSVRRIPRSTVSSYSNASSGVCLSRSSPAIRRCRKPCADPSPARLSARVSASPRTLTYTRAWRRSGLVLTAVTVTNPTRGSLISLVMTSL